jgi:hypothetical protein
VSADTETNFTQLQAIITATIKAQYPSLLAVEFDREDRDDLEIPACLLDMPEFEGSPEIDPGTGQLAVTARFEAEFILGFRTPSAKLAAREMAAAFAAFIHTGRWPGGRTGPAEHIHAYKSDFNPALDQYEVWCVEWRQVIHLGTSVWTNDGTIPSIVYSWVPDIGFGHEADYKPLPV